MTDDDQLLAKYDAEATPACDVLDLRSRQRCTNKAEWIADLAHNFSTCGSGIGLICDACYRKFLTIRYPTRCQRCGKVLHSPASILYNLRRIRGNK